MSQSAQEAEAAGFGAAMSSDHFSPWSERQGAATLCELFPGRLWVALGPGEPSGRRLPP